MCSGPVAAPSPLVPSSPPPRRAARLTPLGPFPRRNLRSYLWRKRGTGRVLNVVGHGMGPLGAAMGGGALGMAGAGGMGGQQFAPQQQLALAQAAAQSAASAAGWPNLFGGPQGPQPLPHHPMQQPMHPPMPQPMPQPMPPPPPAPAMPPPMPLDRTPVSQNMDGQLFVRRARPQKPLASSAQLACAPSPTCRWPLFPHSSSPHQILLLKQNVVWQMKAAIDKAETVMAVSGSPPSAPRAWRQCLAIPRC